MSLVSYNDEVLHNPCEAFNFENPQTDPKKLATDLMLEKSLKKAFGLAANQIGVSLRVFAFENEVAFNPEVIEYSSLTERMTEGCLSYPGLWITIERPMYIKAKYYTEDGVEVERDLTGLETRIFLHELDHLDGTTMVDHASKFKLQRAIEKAEKDGYVYKYKELRQFYQSD